MNTDRAAFTAMLDENPADQITRAIFADWLDENGATEEDRLLVLAMRWEVEHGKYPYSFRWLNDAPPGPFWNWHRASVGRGKNSSSHRHWIWRSIPWPACGYSTREDAELVLGKELDLYGETVSPVHVRGVTAKRNDRDPRINWAERYGVATTPSPKK